MSDPTTATTPATIADLISDDAYRAIVSQAENEARGHGHHAAPIRFDHNDACELQCAGCNATGQVAKHPPPGSPFFAGPLFTSQCSGPAEVRVDRLQAVALERQGDQDRREAYVAPVQDVKLRAEVETRTAKITKKILDSLSGRTGPTRVAQLRDRLANVEAEIAQQEAAAERDVQEQSTATDRAEKVIHEVAAAHLDGAKGNGSLLDQIRAALPGDDPRVRAFFQKIAEGRKYRIQGLEVERRLLQRHQIPREEAAADIEAALFLDDALRAYLTALMPLMNRKLELANRLFRAVKAGHVAGNRLPASAVVLPKDIRTTVSKFFAVVANEVGNDRVADGLRKIGWEPWPEEESP